MTNAVGTYNSGLFDSQHALLVARDKAVVAGLSWAASWLEYVLRNFDEQI